VKTWVKERIGWLTPREHMMMAFVFALLALMCRILGLDFLSGTLQWATGIRIGVVLLGYRWKVWEDA